MQELFRIVFRYGQNKSKMQPAGREPAVFLCTGVRREISSFAARTPRGE